MTRLDTSRLTKSKLVNVPIHVPCPDRAGNSRETAGTMVL